MTALGFVLHQPWVAGLGWTLVHFLWQGTAIAAAYAIARAIGGRFLSARGRYALACAALAAMAAAPPVTFLAARFAAAPAGRWTHSAPAWQQALPWLALGWAVGVLVFSARLFGGWRLTVRLRRVAVAEPPAEWRRALDELMARMRVSAPVRLLSSSLASAPVVVGWLKPVILMPVEVLTGLPAGQVRALLAHELAHVLRRDYLVNIIQSAIEAALFYHPAVWWVSERVRAEREACCDDLAVEATGDPLIYAGALADLDTRRKARLRLAAAATGGSLVSRIRRLLGQAEPASHSLPGVGMAWTMTLLWLLGLGAVVAQSAHSMDATAASVARRAFVLPAAVQAQETFRFPALPPVLSTASPLTAALMFDPFFAQLTPQSPQSEAELASVSGTVLTTTGKPIEKAAVTLSPSSQAGTFRVGNTAVPAQAKGAVTGADGKFAIDKVRPGVYWLTASHPLYLNPSASLPAAIAQPDPPVTLTAGQSMGDVRLTLLEPATISGKVVDWDGDPVAHANLEVIWWSYVQGVRRNMVMASASSGDDGSYKVQRVPPGTFYFEANSQPTGAEREPIPAAKPGQDIYNPSSTYFGGSDNLGGASTIDIAPGQNITLPTIEMKNHPIRSVRGKVAGDMGLVADARVLRLLMSGRGIPWMYGADIHADGSFDLPNFGSNTDISIGVYSMKLGLLGWTHIYVGKQDLDGVVINIGAAPLKGLIRVEDADRAASAPKTPYRVTLTPIDSPSYIAPFMQTTAAANSDGSFAIQRVPYGRFIAEVTGLPSGSYLKSVRLNLADSLEKGFDWSGSGSLELVVGSKGAKIEGTVLGDDGQPAPGTVTLVPDSRCPGRTSLYPTVKADAQGHFRMQNITPGAYHAYAWEEIADTAHWDPEFMRVFDGSGEPIHVDEDGSATVTLRRIKATLARAAARRPLP